MSEFVWYFLSCQITISVCGIRSTDARRPRTFEAAHSEGTKVASVRALEEGAVVHAVCRQMWVAPRFFFASSLEVYDSTLFDQARKRLRGCDTTTSWYRSTSAGRSHGKSTGLGNCCGLIETAEIGEIDSCSALGTKFSDPKLVSRRVQVWVRVWTLINKKYPKNFKSYEIQQSDKS